MLQKLTCILQNDQCIVKAHQLEWQDSVKELHESAMPTAAVVEPYDVTIQDHRKHARETQKLDGCLN